MRFINYILCSLGLHFGMEPGKICHQRNFKGRINCRRGHHDWSATWPESREHDCRVCGAKMLINLDGTWSYFSPADQERISQQVLSYKS